MEDRDYLIQTNHYASDSPFTRHNRPQAETMTWDDPAWDGHGILQTSVGRHGLIDGHLVAAYGGGSIFDLGEVLRQAYALRPVWNHETAQWVEMVPETGALRAWVRGMA